MQDERMDVFLNSFMMKQTDFLTNLEEECIKTQVPVIGPQMQSLLRFLITLHKPVRILEVGCAIGYSSILMAEYSLEESHITTIEKYEKRIPLAHENIKAAGFENKITLLEGDAFEILGKLEKPFDFIFMDAAKAQYIRFLPDV
jgi:predicted O-methyltransferase YrrM